MPAGGVIARLSLLLTVLVTVKLEYTVTVAGIVADARMRLQSALAIRVCPGIRVPATARRQLFRGHSGGEAEVMPARDKMNGREKCIVCV